MDADNIIIRITSEADLSDAQQQIAALKDKSKELTEQIKRLQEQEEQDAETIKSTIKDESRLGAKLKENAEYYRKECSYIEQDIEAGKKNIKTLQQSVNQYNALSGAGVKMRQQLMAIREEMLRMAEAGDTTSERFIELADNAATLSDTIGDAQAVITLLASDTKNLDAAMQVGGGLVGTFNAATSAMALLGGESEELQQAFLKVQAAMSVLTGVQQVLTVLDKRSAANVVIRTAAIKLLNKVKGQQVATETASAATTTTDTAAQVTNTAATNASTAAIKTKNAAMAILNKTILANPVLWLIAGLAALVAGITMYVNKVKKAKDGTDAWNKAMERLENRQKTLNKQIEYETQLAEAQGKSWKEVWQIQMNGAKQYLSEVQKKKEAMDKKWQDTQIGIGKWTDEDEKHRDEIYDKCEEAWEYIGDLQHTYDIKMAADQTAAAKEAEERLKDELAERKRLLVQAAEDERTVKQVLNNLDQYKGSSSQSKTDREEEEDTFNAASFESVVEYNTKRMKAEGETDDKIYEYRYNLEKKYWTKRQEAATFGSQEYVEASTKLADLEIENNERVKESAEQMSDQTKLTFEQCMQLAAETMNTIGQIADQLFSAFSSNIQAQIDALDEMYTTDAEEAKEDASKKYISEKELEEKKARLKLKQQKLDKANALFQIGINTATAITSAMTLVPPLNWVQVALVSALGATQLAVAAAKPLSQYAKGRKGGQGEYALVGEKGAEIMYVPQGASIIPHNKIDNPAAWGDYGVPQLPIPATADISPEILNQAVAASQWQPIDYDRLGRAVAEALPKQRAVNINVDRAGVSVQSGNDTRTYLNTKYNGQW